MIAKNSRADALTYQQVEALAAKHQFDMSTFDYTDSNSLVDLVNDAIRAACPALQPAPAPADERTELTDRQIADALTIPGLNVEAALDPREMALLYAGIRDLLADPPSPSLGERSAFEAALERRAQIAGFRVDRMTECELENAWWAWQARAAL